MAEFDPEEHPRYPKGHPKGGQFAPKGEGVVVAGEGEGGERQKTPWEDKDFRETPAYKKYDGRIWVSGRGQGDAYLREIVRDQGFDGLPDVVSEQELDGYIADGEMELFRGVTDESYVEAFQSGEYYAGEGIYGNGIYTSAPLSARGRDIAYRTAFNYAAGEPSRVMRMTLKKGARTVVLQELEMKMIEEERAKTAPKAVLADPGRYAAWKGYDAIMVTQSQDEAYVIVLNRKMVRVQREPAKDPAIAPGPLPKRK